MTDPDDPAPGGDARPRSDALDRTRDDLARHAAAVERHVATEPCMPADVLARVDRALAAERARPRAGAPSRPHARQHPPRRPPRRGARPAVALLAGAAVATATLLAVGVTALMPPGADPSGSPGPPVAGSGAADGGPGPVVRPALARGDGPGALRAGLGRDDYGPLSSSDRLEQCLGAHGEPPGTVPVGGREVLVDGRPAVVLVLTTGTAARFRVLVVDVGCRAGAPLTVTDTAVGR